MGFMRCDGSQSELRVTLHFAVVRPARWRSLGRHLSNRCDSTAMPAHPLQPLSVLLRYVPGNRRQICKTSRGNGLRRQSRLMPWAFLPLANVHSPWCYQTFWLISCICRMLHGSFGAQSDAFFISQHNALAYPPLLPANFQPRYSQYLKPNCASLPGMICCRVARVAKPNSGHTEFVS